MKKALFSGSAFFAYEKNLMFSARLEIDFLKHNE